MIGPYTITISTITLIVLMLFDSLKVNLFGFPKFPGQTPQEIAQNVIANNLHGNLIWSGAGHYHFMWAMDVAISAKGLTTILYPEEFKKPIQYMIDLSVQKGRTASVYSSSEAFDVPTARGDSLPALLYIVNQYLDWSHDADFFERNKEGLQLLLADYEKNTFDQTGLIKQSVSRDWIDGIDRPSSTWNNLWAIETAKIARQLKLKTNLDAKTLGDKILAERFKDGAFVDHAKTEDFSVDSNILALYLELFDKKTSESIYQKITAQTYLFDPFPIKAGFYFKDNHVPLVTLLVANGYFDAYWPFLGIMYLNGSKKLGHDYSQGLEKIENLVLRYHNFPESLTKNGDIYRNINSSESGLTMEAAQYLELTSQPIKQEKQK